MKDYQAQTIIFENPVEVQVGEALSIDVLSIENAIVHITDLETGLTVSADMKIQVLS